MSTARGSGGGVVGAPRPCGRFTGTRCHSYTIVMFCFCADINVGPSPLSIASILCIFKPAVLPGVPPAPCRSRLRQRAASRICTRSPSSNVEQRRRCAAQNIRFTDSWRLVCVLRTGACGVAASCKTSCRGRRDVGADAVAGDDYGRGSCSCDLAGALQQARPRRADCELRRQARADAREPARAGACAAGDELRRLARGGTVGSRSAARGEPAGTHVCQRRHPRTLRHRHSDDWCRRETADESHRAGARPRAIPRGADAHENRRPWTQDRGRPARAWPDGVGNGANPEHVA